MLRCHPVKEIVEVLEDFAGVTPSSELVPKRVQSDRLYNQLRLLNYYMVIVNGSTWFIE